jgi:hypothetical protein
MREVQFHQHEVGVGIGSKLTGGQHALNTTFSGRRQSLAIILAPDIRATLS